MQQVTSVLKEAALEAYNKEYTGEMAAAAAAAGGGAGMRR